MQWTFAAFLESRTGAKRQQQQFCKAVRGVRLLCGGSSLLTHLRAVPPLVILKWTSTPPLTVVVPNSVGITFTPLAVTGMCRWCLLCTEEYWGVLSLAFLFWWWSPLNILSFIPSKMFPPKCFHGKYKDQDCWWGTPPTLQQLHPASRATGWWCLPWSASNCLAVAF